MSNVIERLNREVRGRARGAEGMRDDARKA